MNDRKDLIIHEDSGIERQENITKWKESNYQNILCICNNFLEIN